MDRRYFERRPALYQYHLRPLGVWALASVTPKDLLIRGRHVVLPHGPGGNGLSKRLGSLVFVDGVRLRDTHRNRRRLRRHFEKGTLVRLTEQTTLWLCVLFVGDLRRFDARRLLQSSVYNFNPAGGHCARRLHAAPSLSCDRLRPTRAGFSPKRVTRQVDSANERLPRLRQ